MIKYSGFHYDYYFTPIENNKFKLIVCKKNSLLVFNEFIATDYSDTMCYIGYFEVSGKCSDITEEINFDRHLL